MLKGGAGSEAGARGKAESGSDESGDVRVAGKVGEGEPEDEQDNQKYGAYRHPEICPVLVLDALFSLLVWIVRHSG